MLQKKLPHGSCGWRGGYAGTLHKFPDPTLHVKKSRDIDHTVVPNSEPATSFWICKKAVYLGGGLSGRL